MSEEVQEQEIPQEVVTPQEETVKPSAIEELARKLGHKPKEEFDGDPERWVDADEFVAKRFERLTERHNDTTKKMTELDKTLKAVTGHVSKIEQAAYQKAINDLKKERRTAIEEGDVEQAEAIDIQMDQIKEALTPPKAEEPKMEVPKEVTDWEAKNGEWFYKDLEVSDFGMAHFQTFMNRHPQATVSEALESMEKAVKKAFPEKFENQQRKAPAAVETGGEAVNIGSQRKFSRNDLNEDQRRVHDTFVRQGIMTGDAYIKSLVELGELGGKK